MTYEQRTEFYANCRQSTPQVLVCTYADAERIKSNLIKAGFKVSNRRITDEEREIKVTAAE